MKVGKDYWIHVESIEIIQPWPGRSAERERQRAIAAVCYYNATGNKKLLSILTLKNGWVVGSPFLPDALVSRPTVAAPSRAASRGEGRRELTAASEMSEAMTEANGHARGADANGGANGKG